MGCEPLHLFKKGADSDQTDTFAASLSIGATIERRLDKIGKTTCKNTDSNAFSYLQAIFYQFCSHWRDYCSVF